MVYQEQQWSLDGAGVGLDEEEYQSKDDEVKGKEAMDVVIYLPQVDQTEDTYDKK